MKTYFTADTHFNHFNIIKYTNRPFHNLVNMNETLINNWNSRVSKHDQVIFLGDFIFKSKEGYELDQILNRLNGQITFVKGNHDNNNSLNTHTLALEIEVGKIAAYCVHNPIDFSNSYTLNLVAHVHDNWKIRKIYRTFLVNVGVDVWKYAPVDFDEILALIEEYKKELEQKELNHSKDK